MESMAQARIRATIESMSLEEKVGQVFMFGFPGNDPEKARELVTDMHAGGIIYFARNIGTPEETASLSDTLQDWAQAGSPGIPLFISADQEGGIVSRLIQHVPRMPGPMSLAAAGGPKLVTEVSRAIGIQLRGAGINMNLAPVLDVNDNPENPVIGVRSFGNRPEQVASLGCSAVKGFVSAGVIPVGKHFPGHGNTSVDSHLDLPALKHPLDRLEEVELVPFKAAISQEIPAIMTAHIVFHAVDPAMPATTSARALEGLLRGRLGFKGIILTDCLEMAAIARKPGTPAGAVFALRAGCDMLLVSHTREVQRQAYRAVLDAVRSGEVPHERLNQAAARILRLKQKSGIPNPLSPEESKRREFWDLSRRAHLDSVTVVRDTENMIPLRPEDTGEQMQILLAVPGEGHMTGVIDSGKSQPWPLSVTPLGQALKTLGNAQVHEIFMEGPGLHDMNSYVELANRCHRALVITRNPAKNPAQLSFIREFLRNVPDAILISVWDPYDIRFFPDSEAYVCAYSYAPEAMYAVAKILLGQHSPVGKLPVDLPEEKRR